VHSKAVNRFVNFYNATNNELKVFARSNGVDDVHKLQLSDLVTDSKTVVDFCDIENVSSYFREKFINGFSGGWVG
jgi:ribonuclease HI